MPRLVPLVKMPTLEKMRVGILLSLSLLSGGIALAVPPAAPSGAIAYAPNEDRVHLSWIDNSDDETGFKVERYDFTNSVWVAAADLPLNFEVYRGLAPSSAAQQVKYRVASVKNSESSAWVEAEVFKPQGDLDLFHDSARNDPSTGQPPLEIPEGSGARAGQAVSIQIEVFNGTPERFIAENLPAGLSLNSDTGVISGIVANPDVYRILNGVEFDSGKRFQQIRYLRVVPAASTPVVADALTLPVQNIGAEGFINIAGLFEDPARPFGAWIFAAGESIIVALHNTATPKTVENFRAYSFYGYYNGTFVHRTLSNFIIQGGTFGPASATAAPNQWASVATAAPVPNEPGLSNTRGTLALAKLSGDRDSATSGWFLNLANTNASNLDYQNGGFTAFGSVVGSYGLAVMDAIGNLPTGNYNINVSGEGSSTFPDIPVLDATPPAILGNTSLLRVDSITLCPPVEISVVGNSAPAVLDAAVVGMALYVKSKGPTGTTTLTLRATNLDGNTVDFNLPVRIDDLEPPLLKLLWLKKGKSADTVRVNARASDAQGLGSWRYRINKKRWVRGRSLRGQSAIFTADLRGLKKGKNTIELEVFDARGNLSNTIKRTYRSG